MMMLLLANMAEMGLDLGEGVLHGGDPMTGEDLMTGEDPMTGAMDHGVENADRHHEDGTTDGALHHLTGEMAGDRDIQMAREIQETGGDILPTTMTGTIANVVVLLVVVLPGLVGDVARLAVARTRGEKAPREDHHHTSMTARRKMIRTPRIFASAKYQKELRRRM
jgi:hypothetical protein